MKDKKNSYKNRTSSGLTKVSKVLTNVKENLGLEDNLKLNALREIWPLITSFKIAHQSQIAYFDREQNIVITTANSSLATELSMKKIEILDKLKEASKEANIFFKDIRFVLKT